LRVLSCGQVAIDATSFETRCKNRQCRAEQQKGAGSCQPLISVALACVDARERIALPLEAGQLAYIFLAFFFAFFAICSSCASDTS
jgi:hypothetical protein